MVDAEILYQEGEWSQSMKEIIITSSVLILCIMLLRLFFHGKISSRLQYALWLLVALRLVIPSSAQIRMAVGSIEEFRIMDLVESWESDAGDLEERLEEPIRFTMTWNGMTGNLLARLLLREEQGLTGDGPTSIFYAGNIGFSWFDVLRGIWIGGMVLVGIWMIVTNILFWYKLHRGRREYVLTDTFRENLQSKKPKKRKLQEIYPQNGKKQKVKIYLYDGLISPCLYGIPGREAIYLMPDVTEDTDRLRHVLTHEICHRRHGDSFWSILRSILVTIYWFNPFVWIAAVLSKRDCELACDEEALLLLGEEERISYGETLLSIITGRSRLSDLVCTATTMTGNGRSVKERIKMIAEKPRVLGTTVVLALLSISIVLVLVFTKSPGIEGIEWGDNGAIVSSGDIQIELPGELSGICSYHIEENGDIVICQRASGMEAGRFCALSYGTAVVLMENGREIVPLGDYGQNLNLKQYMRFYYDGYEYNNIFEEITTTHSYTPYGGLSEDSVTQHTYTAESEEAGQEIPLDESVDRGVPGTDSNDAATYMIEDESESATPLNPPRSTEYVATEETGTEETESSHDYLPNEQITTVSVPMFSGKESDLCYVYVKADYSGVEEADLEEMESINSRLEAMADQAVVVSDEEADAFRKELLAALSENRTKYLGEASRVGTLVQALPCPDKLVYQSMELHTGSGERLALDLHYKTEPQEVGNIDSDMIFFNAVMLFATVENMEECNFLIDDGTGTVYNETDNTQDSSLEGQGMLRHYETMWTESINYTREDLEEEFGELWSKEADQDGSYVDWLEKLYPQIIDYLGK